MATAEDRIREGVARLRSDRASARRWLKPSTFLVLLMRLLAIVYLGLAVDTWAGLIGYGRGPFLADMTIERQVLSVFLSILYPFVAVGLWMATSWGAVVWLLTAALRLALDLGVVPGVAANLAAALAAVVAVVLYLALTIWRVRRDARTHAP